MFDGVAAPLRPDQHRAHRGTGPRWRAPHPGGAASCAAAQRVLDLAAGTAVSTVELARSGAWCVAADFSLGMLRAGGAPRRCPRWPRTRCSCRSPTASFDAVTISFGLRNVADPDAALAELARVTRPGGRLVVCEFGRPTWAPFRAAYYAGLRAGAAGDRATGCPATRRPTATSASRSGPGRRSRSWPRGSPPPAGGEVAWRDLRLGAVALHRARRAELPAPSRQGPVHGRAGRRPATQPVRRRGRAPAELVFRLGRGLRETVHKESRCAGSEHRTGRPR